MTVEVPAAQARSVRMRSVPAGAMLAVRIIASGRLLVSLVSARQLKEPTPESKPVFRGAVREKLAFRVSVAEAGDYLLVLSNRGGKEAVNVEVEIRAVRRRPQPPPRDYSPRPEKASMSPSASSI